MNQQYRNQFRPSFGMSPLYLAGRDEWIRSFHLGLFEPGNPIRASLVWGPRGIGKTVLLNEFEDIAAQYGWIVLRADPRQDMIHHLMHTVIPRAVADPASKSSRKITGITIAGLGGVNMTVEIGRAHV